jgi:hypothetical protein
MMTVNDIDDNAGVDAPRDDQSMSPVNRPVEIAMVTQRPTAAELDHSEQGVDTLMDIVDE